MFSVARLSPRFYLFKNHEEKPGGRKSHLQCLRCRARRRCHFQLVIVQVQVHNLRCQRCRLGRWDKGRVGSWVGRVRGICRPCSLRICGDGLPTICHREATDRSLEVGERRTGLVVWYLHRIWISFRRRFSLSLPLSLCLSLSPSLKSSGNDTQLT